MEYLIENRAMEIAIRIEGLNEEKAQKVRNIIVVLILAIQISYLQSVARRYTTATLLF
ncbi:hypothetical protein ACOI1C_21390 [Bacillus sp. DJP31]|uniref:hypothetical protein n=1 Tax=Bacillus sp. DJP31 TaxID=3409789 RepID=UPI003BB72BAC